MTSIFREQKFLFSLFYLFIYQGTGSVIISGGSEFGIAYGMYKSSSHRVTLWAFPNTLSGDCALSLFIQVAITWLVEELLVGYDDYLGHTCDLPDYIINYFYELLTVRKGKFSRYLQWYFEINNGLLQYKDENKFSNNSDINLKKLGLIQYFRRQVIKYPNEKLYFNIIEWLLRKVIRSIIFGALIFIFMWPITMGIMVPLGTKINGHDYYYDHYPTPQIMKLVYSSVLAIISTPGTIAVIIIRNRIYEKIIKENSFIFKVTTHDSAHIFNFTMPKNIEILPSQLLSPIPELITDSNPNLNSDSSVNPSIQSETKSQHDIEKQYDIEKHNFTSSTSTSLSLPKSFANYSSETDITQ